LGTTVAGVAGCIATISKRFIDADKLRDQPAELTFKEAGFLLGIG
jgi:hypothetical protein